MENLTEPTTVVLQHVLQINDVQTQKKNKATVKVKNLECEDDPETNGFDLIAYFGSRVPNFLSVHAKTTSDNITAKLKLSVFDHDGQLLIKEEDDEFDFLSDDWKLGRETLLDLNSITGSKIVIRFTLEFFPFYELPYTTNLCRTQLQSHFIDMFESAAYADVTFLVQNEKMAAHKSVLASRSSYFKNMFEAGMQESASNQVTVTDVEPATFKAVLRFLYSGLMEEEEFASLAELIGAADKYGLDELKKACELAMRTDLQMENLIDALLLADMHNCPRLLRDAKVLFKGFAQFLKQNRSSWNRMLDRPKLLMELLECCTE